MKLLVYAQLPPLLCEELNKHGHDAKHVKNMVNQDRSDDLEIRNLVDTESRIVVTKDLDFYYSHLAQSSPGKLLLISIGNIKNNELLSLFRQNIARIENQYKRANLIELTNESIVVYPKS